MRVLAGRLVVLAYLICVLSPGVALAFSAGAAPCLDDATLAVAHHHDMAETTMPRMHAAHAHHHGHDHDHASAAAEAPAQVPAPSHHDHGKIPGPCCAMMCAVGLTAALPAVTLPTPLATASEAARETRLPGRTPPRLDRPPIVLV